MIELVDFNEIYGKGISAATAAEPVKKTRRAGGAKKKADATTDADSTETSTEEQA